MARKRDIDPALWENEQLAALPRDARLLFIACISQADDEGRLKGSARYLRSKAFPYDEDVGTAEVEAWRDGLIAAGVLCHYEADGEELVHLPTWHRWQALNRRFPSRLPACARHLAAAEEARGPADEGVREDAVRAHVPSMDTSLLTGVVAGAVTGTGAGTGTVTGAGAGAPAAAATAPSGTDPPAPAESLEAFHAQLARFAGYEPSPEFYRKLASKYGHADFEEEGLKIAAYWQDHPKASRSTLFVLNWFGRVPKPGAADGSEEVGHGPHRNGARGADPRRAGASRRRGDPALGARSYAEYSVDSDAPG